MTRTVVTSLLLSVFLWVPPCLLGQARIEARAATITLGGRLHTQLATSSVEDVPSDMFIRRARLRADITVGDFFDARVNPELSGGRASLQDAYVRMRFHPAFRVSFGQFKRAFSLFELASSTDLPIVERDGRIPGLGACAGVGGVCTFSRLTERLRFDGRDVGVRVEGRAGERLSWAGTVTNGEGINVSDVNDGKSFSGRLEVAVAERVSLGLFGASHDHLVGEDTERAGALGADVEVGSWRGGPHLIGAVSRGGNWELGEGARFLAAQVLGSWYVALGRPRLAGIEPLLRLSWGDPDDDLDDDAGLLVTPGLMLYFEGKNGISANVDVYSPGGELDTEWSFKLQTYLYF